MNRDVPREAPPPLDASVDAKHALRWHALHDPTSAETRAFAPKLRADRSAATEDVPPARARLLAFAQTPAERARATE